MNSDEYFTLEALGKFYTDAAKAGGMHYWHGNYWAASNCGPDIGDCQSNYRPKPAPPIVRWLVRFEDETLYHKLTGLAMYPRLFDTEKDADDFIKSWPEAKVIKLVEEQS